MRVILIRHGETDWNKEQVFRGRVDIELNQIGKEQARAVAEALKGVNIVAIYSSPLSRALETAKIIGSYLNLKPKVDAGFFDFDYGDWQGMPHREVEKHYPDLYKKWHEEPHKLTMPGGENLGDVRKRATRALSKLLLRYDNQTVAIISHRVVNKVLLCAVLGLGNAHFWHVKQDTCAINVFDYTQDGFTIYKLNDTCHLKPIEDSLRTLDF